MRNIILCAVAAIVLSSGAAFAIGQKKPPAQDWSFDGMFGAYDRPALRRGFQVFNEVCASCHSLRQVAYRNLLDIDFTVDEVKAFAAEFEVEDGPNDEGEMYTRPALLSDRFVPPFANDNAARAALNGALPPDLSLIVKARRGGPDYLYGLLTEYVEDPKDFPLMDGMSYNEYFPGHQIAMVPPLEDETVEYPDGTKATLDQQSRDLVVFLTWAASPELEERKSLGVKTIIFLIVLTAMLYALKRRIWADIH